MWEAASDQTKTTIKSTLLQLLKVEQVAIIRRKVNDVFGHLAARLANKGGWPELLPTVLEMWSSPHAAHKESVLRVIDK